MTSILRRLPCHHLHRILLSPAASPFPYLTFTRLFASKPKTSASPEPLQTLDDVSFTWTTPAVERPGDAIKTARIEAARLRAKVKAERGRRRDDERRRRLQQATALTTETRGIRDEDNPAHRVLAHLPRSLGEEERAALLLVTSPQTASAGQLLALRTAGLLHRFSKTPGDTGSAEVQVAALSERIAAVRRHTGERRGDVQARKSLRTLEERRRGLLKYLRRRNVVSYEMMMKECGVREEDIDGQGRTAKSGNQARRIPRSG